MPLERKKTAAVKNGGVAPVHDEWDGADDDIILELPPPPDGGYGWVIVICSFFCYMVIDGICFTFGVFLNEFVVYFDAPKSKIALAGSLLGGGAFFMGPIASGFTNRYGCRPVIIVGAILSALFMGLSVFSPNADVLILFYGLLGLSNGIYLLPAIVAISYYFEEKRAISTCIGACGSSVGASTAGPIAMMLIEKLGWKGANLVLAGVYLSCVIAGALMKPLKAVTIPKEEKKELVYQLSQRRGTCVSFESGSFAFPHTASVKHRRLSAVSSGPDNGSIAGLPQNTSYGSELMTISEDNPTIPEGDDQNEDNEQGEEKASTEPSNEKQDANKKKVKIMDETAMKKSPSCPVTNMSEQLSEGSKRKYSEPIFMPLEPTFKAKKSFKGFGASHKYKMSPGIAEEEEPARPNISIYSVRRRQSYFNLPPDEQSVCVSLADNHRVQKSLRHGNVVSPLSRKDTFYQGSVKQLRQQHSRRSNLPYRQSVLRFNPVANVEVVKDSEAEKPGKGTCLRLICHESFCNILSHMVDVSLLKDLPLLLIGISNVLGCMGYFVPFFFIIDAAAEQGIERSSATFLITTIGISNGIGRALSGVLATLPGVDCFMVHNVGMLLCGIAASCIGLMSNFIGFACCAACFGLFGSAFIALTSVVLVSLLSLEKLTSAFGLISLFRGAAVFIGSPVAGAVYEASGNYMLVFFFGGGLLIIGSLFSFLVMIIEKCKNKGKRKKLSRN